MSEKDIFDLDDLSDLGEEIMLQVEQKVNNERLYNKIENSIISLFLKRNFLDINQIIVGLWRDNNSDQDFNKLKFNTEEKISKFLDALEDSGVIRKLHRRTPVYQFINREKEDDEFIKSQSELTESFIQRRKWDK